MTRDEIVEVMAEAIEDAFRDDSPSKEIAAAALTALEASGRAVVPVAEIQFARDAVEDWAGYADDYFKKRHDLAGDLARIDAMLAAHTQEKDA